MVFSHYIETCEVILDYPRIGGGGIKDSTKKTIRNLLHANIDVHSRRLIAEFPADVIKCIEGLQSHCANMTFSDKSRYDRVRSRPSRTGGPSVLDGLDRKSVV